MHVLPKSQREREREKKRKRGSTVRGRFADKEKEWEGERSDKKSTNKKKLKKNLINWAEKNGLCVVQGKADKMLQVKVSKRAGTEKERKIKVGSWKGGKNKIPFKCMTSIDRFGRVCTADCALERKNEKKDQVQKKKRKTVS